MDSYKYEVAFSFCSEDESLASHLNDLIQDRYSTFIYYEKQKELAGKDGEVEFKKIFRNESRVIIILYSQKWGNTTWTRMEEDAVRERAYNNGYNFILFIPTEKDIKMPDWLPKQRLWYGLERYGIDGAASVIESKIQENFGIIKEERAKRLQRKIEFETKKRRFLNSKDGVQVADKEIKSLFSLIEDIADKSTKKEIGLNFIVHKSDKHCNFFMLSGKYSVKIKWENDYWDTLSDAYLSVELTTPMRNPYNPIIYSTQKIYPDLNEADSYGWLSNDKKFFSSESLADYLFKILLNKIDEEIK